MTLSALILFRKPITQRAIVHILKNKGIAVDFQLDTLTLHELLLTNINIENGILIPQLHIVFADTVIPDFTKIKTLILDISSLDTNTLQKLISLLNSKSDQEQKTSTQQRIIPFNLLKTYCELILPTEMSLRLNAIKHQGETLPLNMQIQHIVQSDKTLFSFRGDKLQLIKPDDFELKTEAYFGDLNIACSAEQISITGTPLFLEVPHFIQKEPFVRVTQSHFKSQNLKLVVQKNNSFDINLNSSLKINLQTASQKLNLNIPSLKVSTISSAKSSPSDPDFLIEAKTLNMTQPAHITTQSISLGIKPDTTNLLNIEGLFKIKDISFGNTPRRPIVRGIHLSGSFSKTPTKTLARINATDTSKILHIRDLQIESSNDKTRLHFEKSKSQMQFNSQISSLFPSLKEIIKTLSGSMDASGELVFSDSKPQVNVRLTGKNVSMTTAYGDIGHLSWDHTLLSLDTFSSPREQSAFAQFITVGQTIENVTLQHHIIAQNKWDIHRLSFDYDGAHIEAKNFSLDPLTQKLHGFKASIQKLKLDKILSLTVGPFITAQGELSGHLNLDLQDKVPTVHGKLSSDGVGWIHYRKQGSAQQKNISLSDGPMEILNGYLYNYEYKSLDLDISSDTSYDMKAVLSSYGHNPDYLEGKPLKLNVSLTQNLLAAIQSMMLSYNLPQKLKEKLEGQKGSDP